jgi:hypothetical protein
MQVSKLSQRKHRDSKTCLPKPKKKKKKKNTTQKRQKITRGKEKAAKCRQ